MSAAGKVNIHEALQMEAQQTLGEPMLVTRFIVIRELQPPQGGAYDMGHIQARDTAMRRWVWIAVLVVAAIVGIVLAAQL